MGTHLSVEKCRYCNELAITREAMRRHKCSSNVKNDNPVYSFSCIDSYDELNKLHLSKINFNKQNAFSPNNILDLVFKEVAYFDYKENGYVDDRTINTVTKIRYWIKRHELNDAKHIDTSSIQKNIDDSKYTIEINEDTYYKLIIMYGLNLDDAVHTIDFRRRYEPGACAMLRDIIEIKASSVYALSFINENKETSIAVTSCKELSLLYNNVVGAIQEISRNVFYSTTSVFDVEILRNKMSDDITDITTYIDLLGPMKGRKDINDMTCLLITHIRENGDMVKFIISEIDYYQNKQLVEIASIAPSEKSDKEKRNDILALPFMREITKRTKEVCGN